jgi:hypothetical protein
MRLEGMVIKRPLHDVNKRNAFSAAYLSRLLARASVRIFQLQNCWTDFDEI